MKNIYKDELFLFILKNTLPEHYKISKKIFYGLVNNEDDIQLSIDNCIENYSIDSIMGDFKDKSNILDLYQKNRSKIQSIFKDIIDETYGLPILETLFENVIVPESLNITIDDIAEAIYADKNSACDNAKLFVSSFVLSGCVEYMHEILEDKNIKENIILKHELKTLKKEMPSDKHNEKNVPVIRL